jgi:hypothetical protein
MNPETTATGFVIVDAQACVLDANYHYVRLTCYEKLSQGQASQGWSARLPLSTYSAGCRGSSWMDFSP